MRAAFTVLAMLAVMSVSSTARAQAPASPADGRIVMSAAEVSALAAKLKAEHKDQATMGSPMLRAAGFSANMEYRTAVGPWPRDRLAIDGNAAGRRLHEPADDVEQRGLAASRRPQDRHELALGDPHGNVGKSQVAGAPLRLERLAQPHDRNHWG